jgi:Protein of unknown function DUF86
LPFRDTQTHLRDIEESIDHIDDFLGDMDFDTYRNDLKTKSAVERQLQILTEAAIRLGEVDELTDQNFLVPSGRVTARWATSSGTRITKSMTQLFGTRSRRSYRCSRLPYEKH